MVGRNGQRVQVTLLAHHGDGLAQGLLGLFIALQPHEGRCLLVQTVGGRQAAPQSLFQIIGLLGIVEGFFLLGQ